MPRLTTNLKAILMFIVLTLHLTACSNVSGTSRNCENTGEELFSRVIKKDDWDVKLELVNGETISLSREQFYNHVKANEYYKLFIRRHSSGARKSYSITHTIKAEMKNVLLGPSPERAYQASFILDIVKNCTYRGLPDACKDEMSLDASFDISQLQRLVQIKPRSVKHCSAATMKSIWHIVEPAEKQTRLISCIENLKGEEFAIEFSIPNNDSKKLLLRKVY